MSPSADLILRNARVITLDRAKPAAAAVAIEGSHILEVGSDDEVGRLAAPHTQITDCHGNAIVPGFHDAHCHPIAFAASLLSVDCRPAAVSSIGELQDRVRHRAEHTSKGQWIRATGYNEFYLAEKRHPNRWDLDKATSDHPVKLTHRSGHACVLNSMALKTLGICAESPEPPGGMIHRDLATGEPNGILFEMNPYVEKLMPPLDEHELVQGVRLANEQFLRHGITSVQDATWSDSPGRLRTLQRLKQGQTLSPRVTMMIGVDEIDAFAEKALCTGSDLGSGVRLGAVKIVLSTASGRLVPPQDELEQLVRKAQQAGFQVAIHAVDENEVEAAVAALEYATKQAPRTDHRHRVEHCSVCPGHLIQQLRSIRAVVVTQPAFIYYSGERYLATVPPADLKSLYPIGSLLRNGLRVAAGSDAPVVPVNPLVGIYAAVTRLAETGQSVLLQERVSKPEALEMYTLGAASAAFEEASKGCIAPGKVADLAVLSDDPLETAEDRIKDIRVTMTVIDGNIVWQS